MVDAGQLQWHSDYEGHRDYLFDHERNHLYELALARAVAALRARGQAQRTILCTDVGTGSGLLAMLAARACGRAQVTAYETVPHMAALAARLCLQNRLAVDVVRGLSTDAATSEQRPHARSEIVVAELLDTPGLGEGLLSGHRHASSVLLAPSGFSIPSRIIFTIALVQSPTLRSLRELSEPSLQQAAGTAPGGPGAGVGCTGRGTSVQVDVNQLLVDGEARLLSAPMDVVVWDLV